MRHFLLPDVWLEALTSATPPIDRPLLRSDVKLAKSHESRHFIALHYNDATARLDINQLRDTMMGSATKNKDNKDKNKPPVIPVIAGGKGKKGKNKQGKNKPPVIPVIAGGRRKSSTSLKAIEASSPVDPSSFDRIGDRAPQFCFNLGVASTQRMLEEFFRNASTTATWGIVQEVDKRSNQNVIRNFGATCYANAVFQLLASCCEYYPLNLLCIALTSYYNLMCLLSYLHSCIYV